MSQTLKKSITVDSVLADLLKLSPRERLEVIARAAEGMETEVPDSPRKPKKSLRGLWEGVSISAEEIDEARREMWANFPRDDIA